jgi:serine/threonine-protein kinase
MSTAGPTVTESVATRRTLTARYELRRRIGSGGMADVYLAIDRQLDREVAIKLLRPEAGTRDDDVERFRREAALLGMVDSPHVVAIHDAHFGPDGCYLVLRHVRGRTLSQLVADDGPLPPDRALRVVGGVLDGLRDLHARGLVHRDLTPSNVIVDERDRAVLLDLGVARDRRRRRLTPDGAAFGTPGYLTPEHERLVCDHRADQYQAGLLLLLALTGATPADGARASVEAAVETLVAPLGAVVARALAPAPDDRFDDIDALHEALDAAVIAVARRQGRPSSPRLPPRLPLASQRVPVVSLSLDASAPTTSPTVPLRRARRRRPPPVLLAIACALTGTVAGIVLGFVLGAC